MKLLIIAAHPDDELMGAGGVLLSSLANKDDVMVVYVTTGATSAEPAKKGELREKAVREIGKEIGLKRQMFLGFPERSFVNKSIAEKGYKKIADIIKTFKPDKIYAPAYEGGHFDHDIINLMVNKCARQTGSIELIEYESYNNKFGIVKYAQFFIREVVRRISKRYFYCETYRFIPIKGNKQFRLKMTGEELKKKNDLIRKYFMLAEKQYDGKEPKIMLNAYKRDSLREMPKHDYSRPPHRRIILPLGYELAFKIPFARFREIAEHIEKM